jgi:hypothetical protein
MAERTARFSRASIAWLAAGFDISGVFFKQNDSAQGFWNKSPARAERRPACRRTDSSE